MFYICADIIHGKFFEDMENRYLLQESYNKMILNNDSSGECFQLSALFGVAMSEVFNLMPSVFFVANKIGCIN